MSSLSNPGHRERMRQRFLETGLSGFHAVNTLELLLFYALPRKDTNPIAHRLLDRFGSLAGVMDASVEELKEVEGMGEQAAVLLKLIPAAARQYQLSKMVGHPVLDSTAKAGAYLLPYYLGESEEVVYLLCLDASCRCLYCGEVARGGLQSAALSLRSIAEVAMRSKAVTVILSHNHPSGSTTPSWEDEQTTKSVRQALAALEIQLVDHIIVAHDQFVSMADLGFFD